LIAKFLDENDLGVLAGEQGGTQLGRRLVRFADISFYSWDQFPEGELPEEAYPKLAPDLAIEVLSKGNTKGEMRRKRKDYFKAGVKLVWMVDRFIRAVTVYTSETEFKVLREGDILDGGEVLPGFEIPVRSIFESMQRRRKRK
jgi:Uma2 family endonuclease